MPELFIDQIKFPSGNIYPIRDSGARDLIAALEASTAVLGMSVTELTDGATTNPITVRKGSETVTVTAVNGNMAFYDKKEFIYDGATWIEFGDLSSLGQLAYQNSVTLNKGAGDVVLGADTTFSNSSSAVSFTNTAKDDVLGVNTTFSVTQPTIAVTPSTTNIKATATGTAVGASTTDTFVKSYPGTTSKLVTTSIPNVTGNTTVTANKSTWGFNMGTGNEATTLVISGGNGSDVTATNTTLGTSITAATGGLASNGGGSSVMTGLGSATTAEAVTGVQVTAQPTVSLLTGAQAGSGVVSVATGISSATATGAAVSANNDDHVSAVTSLGTGTAAAQTITVGSNDQVTVAKHGDLSVTVN